jgi:hypothetical protein
MRQIKRDHGQWRSLITSLPHRRFCRNCRTGNHIGIRVTLKHLLQQVTLYFNIIIAQRHIHNLNLTTGNRLAESIHHLTTAACVIRTGQ